jgi:hypothetical protein
VQYAECIKGIEFDSYKGERWYDSAKSWLDGSVTKGYPLGEELKALVEGFEVENCAK